jgi:mRNA interferase MazF
VTFDRFDTVVVPFPFADRDATKKRPAVVLSDASFTEATGTIALAMITSAKQSDWPGDTAVADRSVAGLPLPSKVRMKLFTLEQRLIERRIGMLSPLDRDAVQIALKRHILP